MFVKFYFDFFMQEGVKDESGIMKCNFNAKAATKFNLVARSELCKNTK